MAYNILIKIIILERNRKVKLEIKVTGGLGNCVHNMCCTITCIDGNFSILKLAFSKHHKVFKEFKRQFLISFVCNICIHNTLQLFISNFGEFCERNQYILTDMLFVYAWKSEYLFCFNIDQAFI